MTQLIKDIADLQTESFDESNIEQIVALNQQKMKTLFGTPDDMGIGQRELIEFR